MKRPNTALHRRLALLRYPVTYSVIDMPVEDFVGDDDPVEIAWRVIQQRSAAQKDAAQNASASDRGRLDPAIAQLMLFGTDPSDGTFLPKYRLCELFIEAGLLSVQSVADVSGKGDKVPGDVMHEQLGKICKKDTKRWGKPPTAAQLQWFHEICKQKY